MSNTITVEAEIYVGDVLDKVDGDDLVHEIRRRGLDPAIELMYVLRDSDARDYPTIVERMLRPKWAGVNVCMIRYNEVMGR